MFTGLIQEVGKLVQLERRGNYRLLTLEAEMSTAVKIGDSVACDGACLTVTSFSSNRFTVEASQETEQRTILSDYQVSKRIHLEQALQVGDRLDGHFVTGHIDDCGKISAINRIGESTELEIWFDQRHAPLVVEKGSIAVNGISLTVNQSKQGVLTVNLIPHTMNRTTVVDWAVGQKVNLEFDLIGKHILKIQQTTSATSLTKQKLLESGW